MKRNRVKLKMLSKSDYYYLQDDPIRFYFTPIVGKLYRRRVELVLEELTPGKRVLDVGYGSGVAFLNLNDMFQEIFGTDLFVPPEKVAKVFHEKGVVLNLTKSSVLDLPYKDGFFDSVIAISIFEHLKPNQLRDAFAEIKRVLKPGGHIVYGVPVERPLMVFLFKVLGVNIHELHFSTEKEVADAARSSLREIKTKNQTFTVLGPIYEVGNFSK